VLQLSGGTHSLAGTLSGTGTVRLTSGTLSVDGPVSGESGLTLSVTGGTMTGAGNTTLAGGLVWTGGTIGGSGTLTTAAGSVSTVQGATALEGAWVNAGAATFNALNSTQDLTFGATGTLTNAGTFTIAGATGADLLGAGAFVNSGLLLKQTTNGNLITPTVINTGTLAVQSGQLSVTAFPVNAGLLDVSGSAVLATGGNPLLNTGTVVGAGTVNLAGALMTNDGTLAPGALTGVTTGTLTIDGNVTQGGSGVVNLEMGPSASGFDRLAVSGTHAMTGGTLNIASVGGFEGPATDVALMTFGAGAGTLTPGTLINGATLGYGPNSMLATLAAILTNTWTGLAGDNLWQTGGNWSLGHAPTTTEHALVPDVGPVGPSLTISVPVAGQSAQRITSAENLAILGAGDLLLGAGTSSIGGLLTISSGALTANGPLTVQSLVLSGGALSGTGAVNVTGTTNWSGGTIANTAGVTLGGALAHTGASTLTGALTLLGGGSFSGASALTVAPGGVLDIASTVTTNRLLDNSGTVRLSGAGQVNTNGNVAVLTNRAGGVLELAGNGGFQGDDGALETLSNAGLIVKTGGTLSSFASVALTNGGTVEAQAGTLSFPSSLTSTGGRFEAGAGAAIVYSGTQSFQTGTQFTGAGTNRTIGGSGTLSGAIVADNYEFAGGSMGGTATVSGSGFTWTGGTFAGAGTLTSTGTFNVAGSGGKSIVSPYTLANQGTMIWTSTNNVGVNSNGTVLTNAGLLEFRTDTGITGDDGAFETVVNSGVLRKTGGTGTTALTSVTLNNAGGTLDIQSGTLTVTGNLNHTGAGRVSAGLVNVANGGSSSGSLAIDAGALVRVTGGTQSLAGGTSLAGAGRYEVAGGALSINGPVNADHLDVSAGTLTGAGNVTVLGSMNWTGGAQTQVGGVTTIAPGATLTIANPAAVTLSRRIDNQGVAEWTGAGNIATNGNGTVVTNGGLFRIRNDASFVGDDGATEAFVNTGTLQKSVATGTTGFGNVTFTNTSPGVVEMQSGVLVLGSGGSSTGDFALSGGTRVDFTGGYTLNAGTDATGAGALRVAGSTVTIAGAVNAGNVELPSGQINGAGTLMVNGTMAWSGGSMTGPGTTAVSGAGRIEVTGPVSTNRLLDNSGTVRLSGAGQVNTNGNVAVLANRAGGVLELAGNGGFQGDDGALETLSNAGLIVKTGGTLSSFASVALTNSGTVEAQAGTLTVTSLAPNAGTLRVASGAVFSTGGANIVNAASGVVEGAGTFAIGAATLVNDGTIRPGGQNAIGTLTITGGLQQGAGGVLEIEALGTAPGQYDVLNVGGVLSGSTPGNLGVVDIRAIGGYVPAVGEQLPFLTYGARNGTFSTVTSPAGVFANLIYQPGGAASTFANSLLNIWILGGDGNWDVGSNWSLGHAPTALEDVLIPDVGVAGANNTISVPVGAQAAKSLLSQERLTVSGGTLALSQPSTVNGLFTLSGGGIGGAGDLALTGGFAWTGGTLGGPGAVNVTGGTLNLSSGAAKTLDGRTLNNFVAATIDGSPLVLSNGAVFANRSGAGLTLGTAGVSAGSGSSMLLNEGSITRSGAGSVTLGPTELANQGTVIVDTGGLLLPAATTTTGAGLFDVRSTGSLTAQGSFAAGRVVVQGVATFDGNAALGALDLSTPGRLSGGGAVTVSGGMHWSGGTMSGAGTLTITPAGTLTIDGADTKFLEGPWTIENRSVAGSTWSGTGAIDAGVPSQTLSVFVNSGRLTIQTDADYRDGFIVNGGILEKQGTGGIQTFNAESGGLSNTGTFRVSNGAVLLRGTGTHSGTFELNQAGLRFEAGTPFAAGVHSVGDGARFIGSAGTVSAQSGSLALTGAVAGATIGPGTTLVLDGTSIGGEGLLVLSGMLVSDGASAISGRVRNSGGTLDVRSGSLALGAAGIAYEQTGSSTNVAAGATLAAPGGFDMSAGTLTGSGTIAGDLTQSGGTIQPGGAGAVGTLTVTGSYAQQAGGLLIAEVRGTGQADVDGLTVGGASNLAGLIQAAPIGGYAAVTGDTFDVVRAGSLELTALAVSAPAIDQPVSKVQVGQTARVAVAPAGTNAWRVSQNGDWSDAANWSMGRAPTGAEAVLIDRPDAAITVVVTSGALAGGLTNREAMVLQAGTLDVSGASQWLGPLAITGGTLAGAGDKSIRGGLVMASGSIRGGGGVTIGGDATGTASTVLSGGSIDIAGPLAVTSQADLAVGTSVRAASVVLSAGAEHRLDILAPVEATGDIAISTGRLVVISQSVAAGGGLSARVESATGEFRIEGEGVRVTSPATSLVFPNRAAGGFVVNGVEDEAVVGSAGFFVPAGSGSVLGQTLLPEYGVPGGGPRGSAESLQSQAVRSTNEAVDRLSDRTPSDAGSSFKAADEEDDDSSGRKDGAGKEESTGAQGGRSRRRPVCS